MKCPIKFKFSAGKVNEQVMFLKIIAHEQILFDSTVQETFEVSAEIDFPVDVEFWISGKHPSDTIVRDGQVVEDKFIKLDSISFGPVEIESWRIPPEFLPYNNIIEKFQNTYWSNNGQAVLSIHNEDPISWLLDHPETII
jgi:hypothetical protein